MRSITSTSGLPRNLELQHRIMIQHINTLEMYRLTLFLVLCAAASSSAHFTLWLPPSLGFDDEHQATGPCGGSYVLTDRNNETEWPLGGHPILDYSTHPKTLCTYRIALLSDLTSWVDLLPPLDQGGIARFCLPSVAGYTPLRLNENNGTLSFSYDKANYNQWVNQPVVLQIAQYAPDGINYQCAAIKFVPGAAIPIGKKECFNSSGVSAAVAVGFTSTLPWGSVVTPTGTAVPSGMETPSTATTASNSNNLASSTRSSSPAGTSNADSGASLVIDGSLDIGSWIILATMGVGAWFV